MTTAIHGSNPPKRTTGEATAGVGSMKAQHHWPVRRLAIEGVLFLLLAVGGGMLVGARTFTNNLVHDQLVADRISFPPKGAAFDPTTFANIQKYAGKTVDSGPKAKAFSDDYLAKVLPTVAGGKTYYEASAQLRATPNDPVLQAQAETLFKGETTRGLMANAYAWSKIASLAGWAAVLAFVGAVVVLAAMGWSMVRPTRS